ncbi:hypothetical protein [Oceanisphaera arctica]|uniref:Uncharacterized protein n=1 Tax=Oceanisphaera arctica TaxID=641510 RepID=A0A2P5TKV0_9GAMM|nr:hypothetical protein [Oceanisphaera arctica]PPL15797.1 hypothetical protein UN63_11430 [Oceanisphaera arctica]GHA28235.1 hypothetical protein GCM10007082_30500 [Oceanisphaera arctica]
MKSAKEFAIWLHERFKEAKSGVYLTKADIAALSGRQRFTHEFITDIHYELALKGMGFVTDTHREKFYLFHLPTTYWQAQGDGYQEDSQSNVRTIVQSKRHTS